jgi:alcohol dehydrogenase-like protein
VKHPRIIVTHYGGPDALQVLEEECPEPKDGEVRLRVLAAGVSLPDLLMREGVHPETPPLPFTPGWDLIGRRSPCENLRSSHGNPTVCLRQPPGHSGLASRSLAGARRG